MIDEATIGRDPGRGFVLTVAGEFEAQIAAYLAGDRGVLRLRLHRDAALQLLGQARLLLEPELAALEASGRLYDWADPPALELLLSPDEEAAARRRSDPDAEWNRATGAAS